MQLTDIQKVTLRLAASDARRNPAEYIEVPQWTVSNPSLISLQVAIDSLSAIAVAIGPLGACQITASVGGISGRLDIEVVSSEATALTISADAPVPKQVMTAPSIIDLSITSGSRVGGENGKGAYLSVFGRGFGDPAALGTAVGARVYVGGVEVDSYRELSGARTYDINRVQRLTVQIGALPGLVDGQAYHVQVLVNGVGSNADHDFMPNPGDFYFVDPVTGNDTTGIKNDQSKPFRYLQNANGGATFTGIWAPGKLKAGDTIVLRGGTYQDQNGFEGHWCRFQHQTGSPPTGSVGTGYVHIVAYPGEDVHAICAGAGGIHGPGTANDNSGYGKYWSVSSLRIECGAAALDGPVNLQSGSDHARIFDCELGPWPSSTVAPNNAKAGGVAGNGDGARVMFNHVHDIDCEAGHVHTALENHGIYLDGSNRCAKNCEVAYNWIANIRGGSGAQYYNQVADDVLSGHHFHHNFIDVVAKDGLNCNSTLQSLDAYDNIIRGAASLAVRFDTLADNPNINVYFNTLEQELGSGPTQAAIGNTGGPIQSGSVKVQDNVVVLKGGRADHNLDFISFGDSDTTVDVRGNLYYDFDGVQTAVPARDAVGIYGDPDFTNEVAKDFTCQAGGKGVAASLPNLSLTVSDDFYGTERPVSTQNDIGACQR